MNTHRGAKHLLSSAVTASSQLTCDFPYGAEDVEFFGVQRFDVVVDVSVNDQGQSEA